MSWKEFRGLVLTTAISVIGFLVYQLYTSLATNARVDLLEQKLDHVVSSLCIIDSRTCDIKPRSSR